MIIIDDEDDEAPPPALPQKQANAPPATVLMPTRPTHDDGEELPEDGVEEIEFELDLNEPIPAHLMNRSS